jgi:hypothetical protein
MAAAPTNKRKREAFTAADKAWLLDYSDRNPRVSATELGVLLAWSIALYYCDHIIIYLLYYYYQHIEEFVLKKSGPNPKFGRRSV